MQIQQFVMAYEAEQDRLRALLPEGFSSLRPVLRFNAEVRDGTTGYLELNTAAEGHGVRGWVNIAHWEDIPFAVEGKTVTFRNAMLEISFTGVGLTGGCPAEKDDGGCFFGNRTPVLRLPESIAANKAFCHCRFCWHGVPGGTSGVSQGKTLPAFPSEPQKRYPKQSLTAENAAVIPCKQVLGSYQVTFERK